MQESHINDGTKQVQDMIPLKILEFPWSEADLARTRARLARNKQRAPEIFEYIRRKLSSEKTSIFSRMNLFYLAKRLSMEDNVVKDLFQDSLMEIVNNVLEIGHEALVKGPNINIYALSREIEDLKDKRVLSEEVALRCERRIRRASPLAQDAPVTSVESLTRSKFKAYIEKRMDADRERIRKYREDCKLRMKCDSWEKDSGPGDMDEFEEMWERLAMDLTEIERFLICMEVEAFASIP